MQGHAVGGFVINLTENGASDEEGDNNVNNETPQIPDYAESDNEVIKDMDCAVTTKTHADELSRQFLYFCVVLFWWQIVFLLLLF